MRLLASSQGKLTFPEEGSPPAFHCSSVYILLLWGYCWLGSFLSPENGKSFLQGTAPAVGKEDETLATGVQSSGINL